MAYALVTGGQVQAVMGAPPNAARRLDTGAWVMPYDRQWTPSDLAACGLAEIVETTRPDDTPTLTHDRTVELVAGAPTVVWVQRAKTAEEQTGTTRVANRAALLTQAANAIATNTTFLAIASPTNAQTLAQVRALSRQNRVLIRLQAAQLGRGDLLDAMDA